MGVNLRGMVVLWLSFVILIESSIGSEPNVNSRISRIFSVKIAHSKSLRGAVAYEYSLLAQLRRD